MWPEENGAPLCIPGMEGLRPAQKIPSDLWILCVTLLAGLPSGPLLFSLIPPPPPFLLLFSGHPYVLRVCSMGNCLFPLGDSFGDPPPGAQGVFFLGSNLLSCPGGPCPFSSGVPPSFLGPHGGPLGSASHLARPLQGLKRGPGPSLTLLLSSAAAEQGLPSCKEGSALARRAGRLEPALGAGLDQDASEKNNKRDCCKAPGNRCFPFGAC